MVAQAASALSPSTVVINEVESNGDTNDWIELKNTGAAAVDVSGWLVMDNKTETLTIPSGTSIAAGGYYTIDTDVTSSAPYFGLGGADSARIFNGSTLIDSYSWTEHAATTYGRNPDGTGAFAVTSASTKNAANTFATVAATTWPGGTSVKTVDDASLVTSNLSGLDYEAATSGADSLWAVQNGPGTLFQLKKNGSTWQPTSTMTLKYPDGTGNPDAEGVTYADGGSAAGIYVSTERNNDVSATSRPAILKFTPGATGTLSATQDWNLTADLPTVGANLGLEAITWIPDSFLTANGFIDEKTGAAYSAATYANHGTGLFFVGLEANGAVYAYALNQTDGTYNRVATFASGFPSIMDLQFDADTNHLWADCDDTCGGKTATLDITAGHFAVSATYAPPADLPTTLNDEGFALTPNTLCVDNAKPVFWSDDNDTGGFSLREGTINCPTLADAPAPTETSTPTPTPTDTATPTPSATPTPTATPVTVSLDAPSITGTASVGSVLQATIAVSPASATLAYQWLRNGVAIPGATAFNYKLVTADGGARIAVRIAVTVPGANPITVTSASTDLVIRKFSKALKAAYAGTVKVGKTLKAHTNTVSPKPTVTWRWYANGKAIAGATKSSLKITKALKGKKLYVVATAKKSGYTTLTAKSTTSAKVK